MAPLLYLSFRKVLLIYVVVFLHASALILCAFSETDHEQVQSRKQIFDRRRMLSDSDDELEALIEEKQKPKKKSTSTTTTTTSPPSNKNQTKLSKPKVSIKNQTKLITTTSSSKNQTKPLKATNSTKSILSSKSELKKLNSTSHHLIKKLNSTSKSKPSNSTKAKPLDPLIKPTSSPPPKNNTKTTKSTTTTNKPNQNKNTNTNTKKPQKKTTTKQTQPSWIEDDNDQDLVSEFRDLPIKFQQTLLPDLERISTTSKAYINKYNKEITKKYFNPIVGNKYAPTIASIVSFAFILVPLLLVSLVINRFKAYFSLQKLLIFVQVYLSIYFTILCLSSIVTGLEPLKFLYATSRSTYICLQVLQTLGYVLYLLMLLAYLVLVFSTDCGLGTRLLGLTQTFVGFAVGLHYYVAVFHRVVLRQPPKTNWKIHAIYATCFLVICLFNRADRRKKAYLEEGGEEGKKS